MGEPGSRVVGSNDLHHKADGFLQGFLRPRPNAPYDRLEFGERLLDGG